MAKSENKSIGIYLKSEEQVEENSVVKLYFGQFAQLSCAVQEEGSKFLIRLLAQKSVSRQMKKVELPLP